MVEACLETFGAVDVLHNDVGIAIPGGAVELAEEDWDRVMQLNTGTTLTVDGGITSRVR